MKTISFLPSCLVVVDYLDAAYQHRVRLRTQTMGCVTHALVLPSLAELSYIIGLEGKSMVEACIIAPIRPLCTSRAGYQCRFAERRIARRPMGSFDQFESNTRRGT